MLQVRIMEEIILKTEGLAQSSPPEMGLRVVHAMFNPEVYEFKQMKMASSPRDSGR